jgi:hypothetical protein
MLQLNTGERKGRVERKNKKNERSTTLALCVN